MDRNVVGIDNNKIDNLILEIYNYVESIKIILNNIDDIIHDNIKYFGLDCGDEILDFHNTLSACFPVVTQNISSYAEDLINLKKQYSNVVEEGSLIFSIDSHN